MANITYLIGAGASANALPVVSMMKDRMDYFLLFLKKRRSDYKDSIPNIDAVINEIDILLEKIKRHASIDTYAKKLYLRNNLEGTRKLISLKIFLACYFTFEQTIEKARGDCFENFGIDIIPDTDFDKKKAKKESQKIEKAFQELNNKIDERYDVFFATLLKKGLTLNSS